MSTTTIEKTTGDHDDPYCDPTRVQEAVEQLWRVHWDVTTRPLGGDDEANSKQYQRMRAATTALRVALGGEDGMQDDHLDAQDAPPLPAWAQDAKEPGEQFYTRELVLLRRRLAFATYWADRAIDCWQRRHAPGEWDTALMFADTAGTAALRAGLNGHELYNRP